MEYVVTWKGCSEGHYKKFVEVIKEMPQGVKTVDDLEDYLAGYAGVSELKALSFTNWLKANMPHFLYDYSNGKNPTNFKVLSVVPKEIVEVKK
jgi:1,2-phenylacetyl-CoA epoxidase catalytic subunit